MATVLIPPAHSTSCPPQDTSDVAYSQGVSSVNDSSPRSVLPKETLAVLGILGERALESLRASVNPELSTNPQGAGEGLVAFMNYFKEAKGISAPVSDTEIFSAMLNLINHGEKTLSSIHDFARQYESPDGHASKSLLLSSVCSLLQELGTTFSQLHEIQRAITSELKNTPPLHPPQLSTRDTCKVLGGKSRDAQDSGASLRHFESQAPLQCGSNFVPYQVAKVVRSTERFEPHAHLLVDSHSIVAHSGLIERVDRPAAISEARFHESDESVTLQFSSRQRYEGHSFELPGFTSLSVKKDNTTAEATYQRNKLNEKNSPPPFQPDQAEICAPEIFIRLLEKLQDNSFSDTEATQLVAQSFFEQDLLYCNTPDFQELLAACPPAHRVSFILGSRMGDCTVLSAALQQLLTHAGLCAVIESGAVCSSDGAGYEIPGHARVKVYCDNEIVRIDPTLHTGSENVSEHLNIAALKALKEALKDGDAEKCYILGKQARKIFTTPIHQASYTERNLRLENCGNQALCAGHRLKDDFNSKSRSTLYELLATSEQEELIAQVWRAYQRVVQEPENLDSNTYLDKKALSELFGENTVRALEREAELVGKDQSKLASIIPQMIQTISRIYGPVTHQYCSNFIEGVGDIELTSLLLARTLNPNTFWICAKALTNLTSIAPTPLSAHFITRILTMISSESTKFDNYGANGDFVLHQRVLKMIQSFSEPLRNSILNAYRGILPDSVDVIARVLQAYEDRYAPDAFPKEIFKILFPNSMMSPEKIIESTLGGFLSTSQDLFTKVYFEEILTDILIACKYFESLDTSRLSPIITEYIREWFIKGEGQCLDFRGNQGFSALCELICVENNISILGDSDYIIPAALFEGLAAHDTKPLSIQRECIRSHLLKQLYDLGVLDLTRIEEFLFPPTPQFFRAAFNSIELAYNIFSRTSLLRHTDEHKLVKGAEFYLAQVIEMSRKRPYEIPHKTLLSEISKSGLLSEELLALTRTGLHRNKREWSASEMVQMERCIPECVAFLYSKKDSIQLRSLVRIRTLLSALDVRFDESQGAAQSPHQLLPIVRNRVTRELRNLDSLPGVLYLDRELPFILGVEDIASSFLHRLPISDGISGLDVGKSLFSQTIDHILYNADETDGGSGIELNTSLERGREIALSVLEMVGCSEATPPLAPPKSLANHLRPKRWQDSLATNLRLQATDSSQRLLRKLTLTRSEHFDSHRMYVAGDDPRTVDWRASARGDRHVVRTYNDTRIPFADTFHVILNLADFISPPQFEFKGRKVKEWHMKALATSQPAIEAVFGFLRSLVQERRPVTVTVYAFGTAIWSFHHSQSDVTSKGSHNGPLGGTWSQFADNLSELITFHNKTQTHPHAYSYLTGLMTDEERRELREKATSDTLLLYLHTNTASCSPSDPLLNELCFAGRAARVNVEL